MSVRKKIHDPIAAQLTNMETFTMVDMWKAQLTPSKNSFKAGFPAAFISIGNIAWEDGINNAKEGSVTVNVYLFFDKYGDTFEGAIDKEESFSIMETMETAGEKIHWLEGEAFAEITQTAEVDLTERYGRPAYMLSFSTLVYKQIKPTVHVY